MYLDVRNYFQAFKITYDIPSLYLPTMYIEIKNYIIPLAFNINII